ncbi:hypothetical protein EDD86DRAFT_247894 [Gorgonomyces haynaldii]|nr:hypothetical protein EDD86DRAFT_247894 [Gorgonomyces haynaldii]
MSNKRGVAEGVQFQLPPGQERDDILGVTALFLGIGGLMMRHKPISWLALRLSE